MAKPFYRLQRFLRRTQLLFLFLGVAYIMAGSLLLLQRHGLVVSQRGTSSYFPSPSLPSPPRSLEAPALRTGYRIMGNRLTAKGMGYQGGLSEDGAGPHWLISRNQEIRHLRRRWFHSLMSEQEMSRVERATPKRKVRHKGEVLNELFRMINWLFMIIRFTLSIILIRSCAAESRHLFAKRKVTF